MTPEEIEKMQEELANLRRWNADLAEQLKASGVMDIPRFKQTINKLEYEKEELEREVKSEHANFLDLGKRYRDIRARVAETDRRIQVLARTILRVRLSGQVAAIVTEALGPHEEPTKLVDE